MVISFLIIRLRHPTAINPSLSITDINQSINHSITDINQSTNHSITDINQSITRLNRWMCEHTVIVSLRESQKATVQLSGCANTVVAIASACPKRWLYSSVDVRTHGNSFSVSHKIALQFSGCVNTITAIASACPKRSLYSAVDV